METRQSDGAVLPTLQSTALLIVLVPVTHLSTVLCSTCVDKAKPIPARSLLCLKCCVLKLYKNTDTEDTVTYPSSLAQKVNQKQAVHILDIKMHLSVAKGAKLCLFLVKRNLFWRIGIGRVGRRCFQELLKERQREIALKHL